MSKQQNTLFNYFIKSPAQPKKLSVPSNGVDVKNENEATTPATHKKEDLESATKKLKQKESKSSNSKDKKGKDLNSSINKESSRPLKRKLNFKVESVGKENKESVPESTKKRRRVFIDESDDDDDDEDDEDNEESEDGKDFSASDDDYKPSNGEESESDEGSGVASEEDINQTSPGTPDSEHGKPKKRKAGKNEPKTQILQSKLSTLETKSKICGASFMEKLKSMQADTETNSSKLGDKLDNVGTTLSTEDELVVWPHQKLEFLQPDQIRDKQLRRPDHPDYDPSTLHVPKTFLDSLSPGVRQWWILKTDHFDCVLFFKVGKFYELYHMDADVGVSELGFTYMRSEFAHSGFPEISYDKMSSILIGRGYKIARVEQTETPDMMAERCKLGKSTKFDKVVRREICQVTNKGTQVFGLQSQITPNYQPNYMLAVVEKRDLASSTYGICYIDTSIGDFYIGEFADDKNCSRLLTLLSHHMPVLVLCEKSSLSERTQSVFRSALSNVIKEFVTPKTSQLWSAEKTLKYLAENYFAKSEGDNWPLVLRTMQAECDHLGLTPKESYTLALSALGLCIGYIIKCCLEEKILPMSRYHMYVPPDIEDVSANVPLKKEQKLPHTHMVLDAATLSNLLVTGEEHSLVALLDNCCTKFGKRLLHHWICAPSCDLDEIKYRQEAITDLLNNNSILQDIRGLLAPLPDFERHLARMHLFGNKLISEKHPDGRAIMFEEKLYNKKKIQSFLSILKGFEDLIVIPSFCNAFESPLLKRLMQQQNDGGIFPDMGDLLHFFKNAFDHNMAAKNGVIAPEKGVDADYDEIEEHIAEINKELQDYLKEQEKYFGCRLAYFGTDKKRFQIEVLESHAGKAGNKYSLESQRKGNKAVKRYSTNETRNFLKRMQNAEDRRATVQKDLLRRIFEKFSKHYPIWKQCVDCIANLDVLTSLAEYARSLHVICIPEIENPQDGKQPFIKLEDAYHPCMSPDTYIPNGIELGTIEQAPFCILTGPNMGGKSTLMRQVGLLVIMAQIGSHVPAKSCHLSLVDRIFTRLGAKDDIMAGQSTFLVELNETSVILKHATIHSLVLLDELGRGTATYDGTAIAAAVSNYIADLKCRTLFSTHYHNLIDYFQNDKRIILGHMACMVETEDIEDPTQETVTFLYKYSEGACPKSYGFNAAKLAGMPLGIIRRAYELSKKMEYMTIKRRIATTIMAAANKDDASDNTNKTTEKLTKLLQQLKSCHIKSN